MSRNGMMGGALVRPAETLRQSGDLKNYLTFVTSGSYWVDYTMSVHYDFYTGHEDPGLANLVQDYGSTGALSASTSGNLKLAITSRQSSWSW